MRGRLHSVNSRVMNPSSGLSCGMAISSASCLLSCDDASLRRHRLGAKARCSRCPRCPAGTWERRHHPALVVAPLPFAASLHALSCFLACKKAETESKKSCIVISASSAARFNAFTSAAGHLKFTAVSFFGAGGAASLPFSRRVRGAVAASGWCVASLRSMSRLGGFSHGRVPSARCWRVMAALMFFHSAAISISGWAFGEKFLRGSAVRHSGGVGGTVGNEGRGHLAKPGEQRDGLRRDAGIGLGAGHDEDERNALRL